MGKDQKQSLLTRDVADLFQKKAVSKAQPVRKGLISMSKQTMNLVYHEPVFRVQKVLLVVLIAAVMMVTFVKFGILDPVNGRAEAYKQLAAKQEQYADARKRLEDYEEIASQYTRYSYGLMTENEINLVNRMDVLKLVEKEIAPNGHIQNFAVNNNVLTVNMDGITLDRASNMVNRLEQNDLVTKATINSASAEDGVAARIFVSIYLARTVEEGT